MSQTAVIWDPRYLRHETGEWHPESPGRLLAIQDVLTKRPIGKKVISLEPRLATPEEISLLHDSEYVFKIQKTAGQDVQLDPDTRASPHSWEAASLAVGGLLNAVDWVFGNPPSPPFSKWGNAFAFVRPPGHHAEKERAMGFCLFNNVAVAAEYALKQYNLSRILILDFDVHHGNGTQWAFYDRKDVFYISTHRYPFYPGTGSASEEGKGVGKGFTLNLPFRGGEGDDEHLKIFDQKIIPTILDYRPELILVSAGFDSHVLDPLGGMRVTAEGFGGMTTQILKAAAQVCESRVVYVLEGGYDLKGLADSVEKCLEVMVDKPLTNRVK